MVLSGVKVVAEVPFVMPNAKAFRICGFVVSVKGLGEYGIGVFPVVFSYSTSASSQNSSRVMGFVNAYLHGIRQKSSKIDID